MGDERRINQLTAKAYDNIGSSDYFAVDNASEAESKKLPASSIKTPISNLQGEVTGGSDTYSSTKNYSVGMYATHTTGGVQKLYRCKTACTAASWTTNASCFEEANLADAVSALNNELGFGYAENTNAVNNYKYPLQIRVIKQKTISHNTKTLAQFTQFPHNVLYCMAFPHHDAFAATSTVSFSELSNGSVKLFQYNSSGVAMFVSAIIIGY